MIRRPLSHSLDLTGWTLSGLVRRMKMHIRGVQTIFSLKCIYDQCSKEQLELSILCKDLRTGKVTCRGCSTETKWKFDPFLWSHNPPWCLFYWTFRVSSMALNKLLQHWSSFWAKFDEFQKFEWFINILCSISLNESIKFH